MIYQSINNEKIKNLKKLKEKKYRDKENKFLVEGYHLVEEAKKAGILESVITTTDYDFENVLIATKEVIKLLSTTETPQEIIGVCKKIENGQIGDFILALDNIQDPGNLGTIIRSAVAFNVDTILLSDDSVDLYNSKVLRATQGMCFNINIIRCNLMDTLNKIKNEYQIITTNVEYGKDVKSLEKKKKICIIMGNEGNGVKKELQNLSTDSIYIKMNKKCESLNVGVATSILLYELGSD
jgi:TrmH family RNA methyltransferase